MDKKSMKNIAYGEVFKTGISVAVLVLLQVAFSALGFAGVGFAAILYSVAIIFSNWFSIDPTGIEFGPDSVLDEKTRKTPTAYLVRTGVNLALMTMGLILWFIAGVLHGVDATFATAKKPEHIVKQMAGDSIVLKIFYLTLSHVTLFSFARFWINSYEAMHAYYLEITGDAKKKK